MTAFLNELSPMAGFKITPNHWDRDPRLSLKAKGLLNYLATHSAGYKCTLEQMIAETKDGRDAVYSALAELKKLDYLIFTHERDARKRPIKGKSAYTWGPASRKQQYERKWGPGTAVPEDGEAEMSDQQIDENRVASSQVSSASGFSGSGEAGTGNAASGGSDTKKEQSTKKYQEPKKDHSDQPTVDRPGGKSDTSPDAESAGPATPVQPRLDGEVDPPAEVHAPSPHDVAMGISRGWIKYREDKGLPVVVGKHPGGALQAVATLVKPFLGAGCTEKEIKLALARLDVTLPPRPALERAVQDIREGRDSRRPSGQRGNGGNMTGITRHVDSLTPEQRRAENPLLMAIVHEESDQDPARGAA